MIAATHFLSNNLTHASGELGRFGVGITFVAAEFSVPFDG
jgi:hypothetical protein